MRPSSMKKETVWLYRSDKKTEKEAFSEGLLYRKECHE